MPTTYEALEKRANEQAIELSRLRARVEELEGALRELSATGRAYWDSGMVGLAAKRNLYRDALRKADLIGSESK